MKNIVTFGLGLYGVDIGTLRGEPAVFIIPNETPGPVGEKIPLELQGPLEHEDLPTDWIAMTFPTRDRCKEVADALVGSKMPQWSGNDAYERAQIGAIKGMLEDLTDRDVMTRMSLESQLVELEEKQRQRKSGQHPSSS